MAVGGNLSVPQLVAAYQRGVFPWFSRNEPIIWWSLDPRFVLFPERLKVSKSMRPYFNQKKFTVTFDQAFEMVVERCARIPRAGQRSTWITSDMKSAYVELHRAGLAHSVEVWKDDELAGGLYGVSLGRMFFGESMFAQVPNASKFGFISLVRALQKLGFTLIDCQQATRHLESLGAESIARTDFLQRVQENHQHPTLRGSWKHLTRDELTPAVWVPFPLHPKID